MCDVRDSTKSLRWNSSVSSLGQLQKSTHVTLHRSHARDHLGVVKSEHGLWTAQPPGSDTGLQLPVTVEENGGRQPQRPSERTFWQLLTNLFQRKKF